MDVFNQDCLEGLKRLESESVDLLCTDPPYGISFMSKGWDAVVPSVNIWKECFRVLKSGSFAFVMSSPRLDVLSQMAVRLSEAGFNTGFTPIYWTYGSGFPKATNISKAVDKKLGFEPKDMGVNPNKIGRHQDIRGGNFVTNVRSETTADQWTRLTSPTSPEAKLLDGSYAGFQPKPAVEVIIVAMKPLDCRTYTTQALKNQKGVTWLDDARIPFQSEDDVSPSGIRVKGQEFGQASGWNDHENRETMRNVSEKGRFPANLLVSDDVLNDGRNHAGGLNPNNATAIFGDPELEEKSHESRSPFADGGSFSRYFSLDAWFSKKLEELPESVRKTFPFLIVPKAGKGERNEGLEGFEESFTPRDNGFSDKISKAKTPVANRHPTVKPLQLMSYLITLGSRPQDVVLDPFMGSGTTGIACKMLNRRFIGYEIDPESFKIAEARIKAERQVII